MPWLLCLLYLVVLVFSATLHEIAHGWTAYKLGDPTAKMMGRITLNPKVHLTRMGFLAMLLLPIGWANPVIINPRNFTNPKRDSILVSIAGPLMNLLLCFISVLIIVICGKAVGIAIPSLYLQNFDNFTAYISNVSPLMYAVVLLFSVFAYLNALLFIFNLLPIPPLDGSRLLTSWLPYKAREWLWRVEQYGIIVLFLIIYLISPFLNWLEGLITNGFYLTFHVIFF